MAPKRKRANAAASRLRFSSSLSLPPPPNSARSRKTQSSLSDPPPIHPPTDALSASKSAQSPLLVSALPPPADLALGPAPSSPSRPTRREGTPYQPVVSA